MEFLGTNWFVLSKSNVMYTCSLWLDVIACFHCFIFMWLNLVILLRFSCVQSGTWTLFCIDNKNITMMKTKQHSIKHVFSFISRTIIKISAVNTVIQPLFSFLELSQVESSTMCMWISFQPACVYQHWLTADIVTVFMNVMVEWITSKTNIVSQHFVWLRQVCQRTVNNVKTMVRGFRWQVLWGRRGKLCWMQRELKWGLSTVPSKHSNWVRTVLFHFHYLSDIHFLHDPRHTS